MQRPVHEVVLHHGELEERSKILRRRKSSYQHADVVLGEAVRAEVLSGGGGQGGAVEVPDVVLGGETSVCPVWWELTWSCGAAILTMNPRPCISSTHSEHRNLGMEDYRVVLKQS